ncbi:rho GTPase-activating protein 7 [Elysia marginata]|uniref:Rho GTPase-activating protein 7 n=1 Tax=Elysia marginata TaxID=1093978 RepID=A0AAV4ISR9_9GAST|nr:rho GTPase-activating protein 7 [Elysia marginata]
MISMCCCRLDVTTLETTLNLTSPTGAEHARKSRKPDPETSQHLWYQTCPWQGRVKVIIGELEAYEALKWLRAAGFPQYAQMFEDGQFPLELSFVEKDHDFLDTDSLQSLFRALQHGCLSGAQILTFYKFQALLIASTHLAGGRPEENVDKFLSQNSNNMRRGWESNPRPPDHKSNALTTEPRCST